MGYSSPRLWSAKSAGWPGLQGGFADQLAALVVEEAKAMGVEARHPFAASGLLDGDPFAVALKTRLNGKTMQDGNTSDWLFALPRLVSFLSHYVPLEPGDIVTTGTPAGVFRNPQVFMKAGDVVEIEAAGIGVLRTPIVAG